MEQISLQTALIVFFIIDAVATAYYAGRIRAGEQITHTFNVKVIGMLLSLFLAYACYMWW